MRSGRMTAAVCVYVRIREGRCHCLSRIFFGTEADEVKNIYTRSCGSSAVMLHTVSPPPFYNLFVLLIRAFCAVLVFLRRPFYFQNNERSLAAPVFFAGGLFCDAFIFAEGITCSAAGGHSSHEAAAPLRRKAERGGIRYMNFNIWRFLF